jgi:hypothetical protein
MFAVTGFVYTSCVVMFQGWEEVFQREHVLKGAASPKSRF